MSDRTNSLELEVGSPIVAVDIQSGPKNIVLTYDDGPEPSRTLEVLKVLAESSTTATFFVLLSRTRLNPSVVGEILSQGHEIALHGVDHASLQTFSSDQVFSRTLAAKQELEDLIGESVNWFRPPYGAQTLESWEGVAKAGLTPVHWSVACTDWEDPLSDDYEQYLTEAREVNSAGAIVLAHDNIATDTVDNAFPVPEAHFSRGRLSKLLLDLFESKGFACCSLRDALATGLAFREPWPLLPRIG